MKTGLPVIPRRAFRHAAEIRVIRHKRREPARFASGAAAQLYCGRLPASILENHYETPNDSIVDALPGNVVSPGLELRAGGTPADADGFRTIFDGKTLDGWDGDTRFWGVEDGCITGQTTKENPAPRNTFLIWRGGKPADFQIKIEFRMPNPGFANSGVQIRSWEGPAKWQVSGYQPDMDSTDTYTGTCYGENYRGNLASRGQKTVIGKDHKVKVVEQFATSAELAKFIKKRDWNEYDITARGNRITEMINGHLMCEVTDEDTKARKDGIIALQIHAGEPMKVQFRNVRLKEFKQDNDEAGRRPAAKKKIVFIAGGPSHGYAEHEHHAGCLLLAKLINENVPEAEAVVSQGWPSDPEVLDGAASIVMYCDGGEGHLVMKHLDEARQADEKGRRPMLHPLCGRSSQGQTRRPDERLDRRLLRDLLVGQSDIGKPASRSCPIIRSRGASSRSRSRRVVLSHAFCGRHEGRHADPHGRPARRSASARQ